VRWRPITRGYRSRIDQLRRLRPHQLLEIEECPSVAEIKHAYRAKVKAYHPDRVDAFLKPHAQEMLKLLNAAYEALLARCRR
jgi:DnaJ-class molecular chaperone